MGTDFCGLTFRRQSAKESNTSTQASGPSTNRPPGARSRGGDCILCVRRGEGGRRRSGDEGPGRSPPTRPGGGPMGASNLNGDILVAQCAQKIRGETIVYFLGGHWVASVATGTPLRLRRRGFGGPTGPGGLAWGGGPRSVSQPGGCRQARRPGSWGLRLASGLWGRSSGVANGEGKP